MPDPGAAPTKVLYVLGSQRGGTTILGRLIGTIEGIEFGGEMRNLWGRGLRGPRSCGCGKGQWECEVWSRVLAELGDVDPDEVIRWQRAAVPIQHSWWRARRLLRERSPAADATAAYGRVMAAVYRSFATVTAAEVVVDISKHPTDAALLPQMPGIEPYYVEIVRDPRGVLYSRGKRDKRGRLARALPWRAVETSVSWTARHLSSRLVLRRHGNGRSLLVRYEDLVAAPDSVLGAVADLVGVSPRWIPIAADGIVSLPTSHPPSGNGLFRATEVRLVEDDRWKTGLRPVDRVLLSTLTLPLLFRHGYAIRTHRPIRERPRTA